jgi:hypothetical protein
MRVGCHLRLTPLLLALLIAGAPWCLAAEKVSSHWKVTSIRICRASSNAVMSNIDAVGIYPVYSFFIPRPVWTINGNVVEAKPVYDGGRLVAFTLLNGAAYLNPGTKNTVKFSLPDHNGSRIFLYDHSRIPSGECYEFF